MKQETRKCQNCKQEFIIEPEDFQFYGKMQVPPPTWCPRCRMRRRLAFTYDRVLYKRNCDLCKKSIVSAHPPDREITVYCNPCWWSDAWDGSQYARDYDSLRPFLKQLNELNRSTPQLALDCSYPTLVNSDYVNHAATAKNCYLIFTADECENVLYSEYLLHNKDSMDGTMYGGSELCYGLINSGPCYRTFFSEDCENCQDVYFSKDLNGCSSCFGCIGLRNKSYHIFNKLHSKKEYQEKLKEFNLDSHQSIQKFKKKSLKFWQTFPHKFSHTLRNKNVTGDYIYSSKNSKDMYVVHEGAEDCRYCSLLTMPPIKDAYDYCIWGMGAQRIYECMITGEGADTIKFSFNIWPNVREIEYSMFTFSSSNMFGCANIRNKKYCILNKQYSKKEYETLRSQIVNDMNKNPYVDKKGRAYVYGEFFPPELSLVGYNESYAMDFLPLSREEAENQGFSWYEPKPNPHKPTLKSEDIPDSINEIEDSIVKEIIECATCHTPFRIVSAELSLLRRFGLPVPRSCPNCRYKERRNRINPPELYHRQCMCDYKVYGNSGKHNHHSKGRCPNEFETSYAPDRKEIVYCEKCYQSEVV